MYYSMEYSIFSFVVWCHHLKAFIKNGITFVVYLQLV
jgi:hypothetical protein